MSTSVYGSDHIDLLVSLIRHTDTYLTTPNPTARYGYDSTGLTGTRMNLTTTITPTDLGRLLLAENVKSVRSAYESVDNTPEGIEYDLEVSTYQFRPVSLDANFGPDVTWAVAGLVAVRGYVYNACEHDGWDTSAAKAWMDALSVRLYDYLPGRDDAITWEYHRPVAARR